MSFRRFGDGCWADIRMREQVATSTEYLVKNTSSCTLRCSLTDENISNTSLNMTLDFNSTSQPAASTNLKVSDNMYRCLDWLLASRYLHTSSAAQLRKGSSQNTAAAP